MRVSIKGLIGWEVFFFRRAQKQSFGCELWNVAKEKRAFKALGVAYHSCIKKLLRVPRWARNHELCDDVNMLPFHMLVASRQLCFWKGLCGSGNRLLSASFVMGEHGSLVPITVT